MRAFADDLSKSDTAFVAHVWPAISEALGGGRLEKVPHQHPLDRYGGVDFWQVRDDITVLRGLAVRVQDRRAWDTFTIRKARPSGAGTEWEKRLRARDSAETWLLPALTIQAYVTDYEAGPLLSVAWMKTADLMWHVRNGLGNDRVNGDDGVIFSYVEWTEIPAHEVTIVRPHNVRAA